MSRFARLFATRPVILLGGFFVAILAFGAALHAIGGATAAPPAASLAITVEVTRATPKDVRIWSQFSGRLSAVDYAEIRPQVDGRITEVRFTDGQIVHAGDILFVIDPRPYEAAAAKAKADLASSRANAALAKIEFERATNLIKAQAVAQSYFDERLNANSVAQANVQVADAALKQAMVDVDRAYVKAPISGRISRPEITVGNTVQISPSAPLLASIVANNGIYADFEVDEQTYLSSVHAAAAYGGETAIPVEMTLQDDNGRSYKGTIYSFDNRIDTGSGTIRARARFDNKTGELIPGMFVSLKLGNIAHKAILVPERAIVADQNKNFVYVVGQNSKAALREVKLGASVDGERLILSGVAGGDRIIVDGLQHVASGAFVKIQSTIVAAATTRQLAPLAQQ